MAGDVESRPAKRLSLRAATEPLPAPLPPPPRPGRTVAAQRNEPGAHDLHSVPPQPHFVARFPAVDPSQLDEKTSVEHFPQRSTEQPTRPLEQPVPERSLASPGVVVSLAASIAVMCAIGWYEKQGIEGFNWDTVKTLVQRWSIAPADAEEDLPYITTVPMSLNLCSAKSIARDEGSATKRADPVVLSDLLKIEAAGTSDDDRTQLR